MGLEKDMDAGEFERCVVCNKLTDVKVDTPIQKRMYYVEGAGQLDAGCYGETYGSSSLGRSMYKAFFGREDLS